MYRMMEINVRSTGSHRQAGIFARAQEERYLELGMSGDGWSFLFPAGTELYQEYQSAGNKNSEGDKQYQHIVSYITSRI